MKKAILILTVVLVANYAVAQIENSFNFLNNRLPSNIELDKSVKRSYRMTTDYYNFDLEANFLRKNRIAGIITYEGDSARWRDVYLSYSISLAKDIRITWIGITDINGKICAIMKYSVMNNPLKIEYGDMLMKGRSHYWGEVSVSLSDKQIEYATLTEDVLTDVKRESQPNNIIGYTMRTISFVRE
jgi:hypothetical protein